MIWGIAIAIGLLWAPVGFFMWRWMNKNLSPRWNALAWPAFLKYLISIPATWLALGATVFLPWVACLIFFDGPPRSPTSFDEQMRSSLLLGVTAWPAAMLVLVYQVRNFFERRRETQ